MKRNYLFCREMIDDEGLLGLLVGLENKVNQAGHFGARLPQGGGGKLSLTWYTAIFVIQAYKAYCGIGYWRLRVLSLA